MTSFWRPLTLCLLTLLLVGLLSCSEDQFDAEIRDVIHREIVTFDAEAPVSLIDILDENSVIIFGETHYVQEHQEFLVSLLPELSTHGYNVIIDEQFHCFDWMVNDYVNSDRDELPEFLLYFNAELLLGIRAFNSTVDDAFKFRFRYMDVNHWQSNFGVCLDEIEKILGTQEAFIPVRNAQVDSPQYLTSLQSLKSLITSEEQEFRIQWGDMWYERITDIVNGEITSSGFRRDRIDEDREAFMTANISSIIDQSGGKGIVNTGMFHGQKETWMGVDYSRLAHLLEGQYTGVYSIAFIGLRGETKFQFQEVQPISFNLPQSASSHNLITFISEAMQGAHGFLPLSDPVFSDRRHEMSYTASTTVSAPIGLQFDAFFIYPEISILESMGVYDWN